MNFGFSYVGLVYLLMLFIPNIIWTKNKPENYEEYAARENKVLSVFEKIGQVLTTCIVLIFSDFKIKIGRRLFWLAASFVVMLLYEAYWIRYFKSEKTMKSFYSDFLKIPVAGATLPIVAFLLLSVYGKNPFLAISTVILGIGHIGIHLNHKHELS